MRVPPVRDRLAFVAAAVEVLAKFETGCSFRSVEVAPPRALQNFGRRKRKLTVRPLRGPIT